MSDKTFKLNQPFKFFDLDYSKTIAMLFFCNKFSYDCILNSIELCVERTYGNLWLFKNTKLIIYNI